MDYSTTLQAAYILHLATALAALHLKEPTVNDVEILVGLHALPDFKSWCEVAPWRYQ